MQALRQQDRRRSLGVSGQILGVPVQRAIVAAEIDATLSGGLERAALHEVYAAGAADLAAATGFALGLALRAAQGEAARGERSILWVRQDFVDAETGRLHAPGLNELGLDPARLLLVRARDAEGVAVLAQHAADLKLDMKKFQSCADSDFYTADINKQVAEGGAAGVNGTPSFVIGKVENGQLEGVRLVGAMPYETFDAKLKELLAAPAK